MIKTHGNLHSAPVTPTVHGANMHTSGNAKVYGIGLKKSTGKKKENSVKKENADWEKIKAFMPDPVIKRMENPDRYEGTEFEITKGIEPIDPEEDFGDEVLARQKFAQYLPPQMVEVAIKAMTDANLFGGEGEAQGIFGVH